MQKSIAHAIVAAPKSSHPSSILVLLLAWSSGTQWMHWSTISTLPLPSVIQSLLPPQRRHNSATLIHMIFILDHPPSSSISVTSQNHKPFFLTRSTSVMEW